MMIENDSVNSHVSQVSQVILASDSLPPEVPVLVAENVNEATMEVPSAVVNTQEAVMGTLQKMYPGHAVLDSGATETVASLEAIEEVMSRRKLKFPHEKVYVYPGQHRSFRFGNGQSRTAESYIELPQLLNGKGIRLGIHTLDVPEVPVLISIQTLRKLGAVINFVGNYVVFEAVNSNIQIPLVQSPSGHLLLDLTQDWMSTGIASGQDSKSASRAYMEPQQVQQLFSCQTQENREGQKGPEDDRHCEGNDQNQDRSDPDNTTLTPASGSSMRLPSFLTLTSFACATLATHGVVQGEGLSTCAREFPINGGRAQSESQSKELQQTEGQEFHAGTLQRAVRLRPSGGTRPQGLEDTGVPVLGSPRANATGPWQPERLQRSWQVGGMQQMPAEVKLHTDGGQSWPLSPSRTSQSGLHQSVGEDDSRDAGEVHRTRKTECAASGDGRGRGIPEEALGGGSSQEECHATERTAFGTISWDTQQSRKDWQHGWIHDSDCREQETGEARERGGSRGARSRLGDSANCRAERGGLEEKEHPTYAPGGERKSWLTQVISEWQAEIEETYVTMPKAMNTQYDLLELCCPVDSTLSQVVMDRGGRAHRCGLPYYDMMTQLGGDRVLQAIEEKRPRLLWISVKCGPWSPLQRLFNEDTEEKYQASMQRRKKGRKMVRQAIRAMRKQDQEGRHVAWEWPRGCEGWLLPELQAFFKFLDEQGRLFTAKLDGCMVNVTDDEGNLMKKPWTIKTTDPELANILNRRCNHTHKHQECVGKNRALKSGFYPKPMCELIAKHLLGSHWGQIESIFPVLQDPGDEKSIEEEPTKKPKLEPPLTEKERKEAFRLVHKLHRRAGHPSNRALAACLQRRGAHPDMVKIAAEHRCNECLELHLPPPAPGLNLQRSEVLWETMIMDGIDMKVDGMMIHGIVMMDEASHIAVIAEIFRRQLDEGRNTTGPETVDCIERFWVQYFGWPAKIRLDPEGAFRSNELAYWAEERGIEVLPCVAEAHQQIGDVEGLIGKIKQSMRLVLQEQPNCDPMSAAHQVLAAHNSIERVQGFSPNQWVFGRDKTMVGRLFEGGHDVPALQQMGTAQSAMNQNLKLRVAAELAYRKSQAHGQISRALNLKTRPVQQFLPGDLVFFKRVKVPAQPAAQVRMGHRLWSWYGPGRVLASETRTDSAGSERKPSHVIWVVSCGRLKRCAPDQLRHASDVEKAVAETTTGSTTSWTFHTLLNNVQKGQFEALDGRIFPEDSDLRVPARRGRSRTPARTSGAPSQGPSASTFHPPEETPKQKTLSRSAKRGPRRA